MLGSAGGLEALRGEIEELKRAPDSGGSTPLSLAIVRTVIQELPCYFALCELDGTLLFINRTSAPITPSVVVGRNMIDLLAPPHRAQAAECLARVARSGEPGAVEADTNPAVATQRSLDLRVAPIRDGGALIALTVLATDVTERKRTEAALRESEEKLRFSIGAAGVGLWSADLAAGTLTWDDSVCAFYGLPPGHGPKTFEEHYALIHPDDRALLRGRREAILATGNGGHVEYRVVRPDGALRWLMAVGKVAHDSGGQVVRLLGVTLDITERRNLEEQLRLAQKMEAVGQLSAGVAHHFNNMLMGILPNVQMAAREVGPELAPLLHDAEQAARRAALMVRQLTTFSGRAQSNSRRIEPADELLDRPLAICRPTFDRVIAVEVRCQADAPPVLVESNQIEHALVNVIMNARDAVMLRATSDAQRAEAGGPRIEIAIERAAVSGPAIAARPEARRVDHLCVRVRDNGVGMDEATRLRIYEPFFTTKAVGEGTGLGLATTYAIVREHGGWITCDSTPGQGTTVSIYLPSCESMGDRAEERKGALPSRRGATPATILVVDDEPMVRAVVSRVLSGAGYRVEQAHNGEEALALAGERLAEVDLALVDVSMPGLTGPQLVRRLREREPALRVLYLTGYSAVPGGDDPLIEKPVSPDALLAAVRGALNRG